MTKGPVAGAPSPDLLRKACEPLQGATSEGEPYGLVLPLPVEPSRIRTCGSSTLQGRSTA
jgi:hypothetical protein